MPGVSILRSYRWRRRLIVIAFLAGVAARSSSWASTSRLPEAKRTRTGRPFPITSSRRRRRSRPRSNAPSARTGRVHQDGGRPAGPGALLVSRRAESQGRRQPQGVEEREAAGRAVPRAGQGVGQLGLRRVLVQGHGRPLDLPAAEARLRLLGADRRRRARQGSRGPPGLSTTGCRRSSMGHRRWRRGPRNRSGRPRRGRRQASDGQSEFSLVVIVPIVLGIVTWYRNRKAVRESARWHQRSQSKDLPS
jgi:hypothetical protein